MIVFHVYREWHMSGIRNPIAKESRQIQQFFCFLLLLFLLLLLLLIRGTKPRQIEV
jgi:hypothetical protein